MSNASLRAAFCELDYGHEGAAIENEGRRQFHRHEGDDECRPPRRECIGKQGQGGGSDAANLSPCRRSTLILVKSPRSDRKYCSLQ